MFLTSTYADCFSPIFSPIIFFNLLASVLEIILYRYPMKLIGRQPPSFRGSFTLGITVTKEELHPLIIVQNFSKYRIDLNTYPLTIAQFLLIKLKLNPYGLSALSFPHDQIAHFTSSNVNGASKHSLVIKSNFLNLGLMSLGREIHFSLNSSL